MGLTETSNSSTSTLEDDELTNLTWLQDNNLLQNMTQDNDCTTSENNSKIFLKEDNENVSPKSLVLNNNNIKKVDLENNLITTNCGTTIPCSVPPIRYNPLLHVHTKPPYSFSSLIFMAIESSPHKALPVKEIYNWIVQNFPFYQDAPEGWKNTVRHNLSLNKCFQKIEKGKKFKGADCHENKLINDQLASKGSLWCIDPLLRPNLLQAIKKTPAHIYPYMSTAKTSTNLVQIGNIINSTNDNLNSNVVNRSNNFDLNNIAVSIGNNISSVALGNNISQTPKKIISLEKLPEKNILTTTKRVLIPIAKVGREPEEADAAESMLTLTQCSTTGSLNNGNIYIITNKKENFLPIQINSNSFVSNTTNKAQNNKNQITAILSQPVVQTPQKNQSEQAKSPPVTQISTTQFNTSTDHNYFSRSSTSSPVKTLTSNLIAATAIPVRSITGQQTKIIVNNSNANLIPVSNINNKLSTNKIITISAMNGPKKGVSLISTQDSLKINSDQVEEKKSMKKQKSDVDNDNDEDGLKCAEALFNLANGSTVKLNTATSKNMHVKKEVKDDQNNLNSKKQNTRSIIKVGTISSSSILNKSNVKKFKTS